MDIAEKAFGAFRTQLINGITQQHNAAKETFKRKCAEQMAQLIREQQMEISDLHDLDSQALVARYLPSSAADATTTTDKRQETAEDEAFDSDEEEVETPEQSAKSEPYSSATVTANKRTRNSDVSCEPATKRRDQSVVSLVSDDSHQTPASPPASLASVASTRPQRARKPPPPREINYSKDKKVNQVRTTPSSPNGTLTNNPAQPKPPPPPFPTEETPEEPDEEPLTLDHQFCHHILNLIHQNRAAELFLHPVDTSQYPTYSTLISKPMDLGTMAAKLQHGQYRTAADFKADFDLMIRNCLDFNPSGERARDYGIMLDRHFSSEWNWRAEWEREVRRKSGGSGGGSGGGGGRRK
jgi:hypothetical protein